MNFEMVFEGQLFGNIYFHSSSTEDIILTIEDTGMDNADK